MAWNERVEEYRKTLSEDQKPFAEKIMFQGRMGGMGHNNRYFVIEDDVAIKISWGDLSQDHINYPMLFETPHPNKKIIAVYDTVYVTRESIGQRHGHTSDRIKDYDLTTFNKKYGYNFEAMFTDIYPADYIIKNSWVKIEKGNWYSHNFETNEFEKQELQLGRLYI